jgi:hypothetical protein
VTNQRFAASSWEQIDFDIFKDPVAAADKGAQLAVSVDPAPAVLPPAPVESPKSVAHTASAPIPGRFSEIPQYWRRHRSRSVVAVLARHSAASVQRAWDAFTHSIVDYARSVRLALFPAIKKPAPTSVAKHRFSARGWAQMEFDIFKDLLFSVSKRIRATFKKKPVPAMPPSAALKSPKPLARPASPSTQGAGEIAQYWRRHRLRSAMAVVAHHSAASVQRAWDAFTHSIVDYARSVRLALFPAIKKPAPTSVAKHRFTARGWAQMEFDIFKDLLFSVSKRIRATFKKKPVPAMPPSAALKSPKPLARTAFPSTPGGSGEIAQYWRRYRLRSAMAVVAHHSAASVQRAWHAFNHTFIGYVRSVSLSFVRDCRLLFRPLTLPTPAVEFGSPTDTPHEKSAAHRNALAPIVNWLRQPITPGQISANRSPARSAPRK